MLLPTSLTCPDTSSLHPLVSNGTRAGQLSPVNHRPRAQCPTAHQLQSVRSVTLLVCKDIPPLIYVQEVVQAETSLQKDMTLANLNRSPLRDRNRDRDPDRRSPFRERTRDRDGDRDRDRDLARSPNRRDRELPSRSATVPIKKRSTSAQSRVDLTRLTTRARQKLDRDDRENRSPAISDGPRGRVSRSDRLYESNDDSLRKRSPSLGTGMLQGTASGHGSRAQSMGTVDNSFGRPQDLTQDEYLSEYNMCF